METRSSLLERITNLDDTKAWREFDAIYRPILRRFARSQGLGRTAVDDVVQDCMASIARNIKKFNYDREKGRFRAWLFTVVRNRVSNWLRDHETDLLDSKGLRKIVSREQSPEQAFDHAWLEEHLRHCLLAVRSEVQPATFDAYRLYVIEERPVDDVCEQLGMTPNQLYKIKWRITQKLNEKLAAFEDGDS